MRDIKFRGQRVDNGEWVYGYFYINDKGKNMIHNPNTIPRRRNDVVLYDCEGGM